MYRITGLIAVLFIALFFAGCSGLDDPTKNWPPEKLYKEAKDKVTEGDYETGIKYFESLEARYPYGRYSEQAQLEIAYANYKFDEPALAIAAADRFIRLHPTHPNVDYAYYLKGLVNFHGEKGFANWLFGATIFRPRSCARLSYSAFHEVVGRFSTVATLMMPGSAWRMFEAQHTKRGWRVYMNAAASRRSTAARRAGNLSAHAFPLKTPASWRSQGHGHERYDRIRWRGRRTFRTAVISPRSNQSPQTAERRRHVLVCPD
jgi:tetratricopeptide (TPR) repeat protein